jgi:hypothetical protein
MENIDETLTPLQYLMSIEDDEFVEVYDHSYTVIESMCYLASLELELNNQNKQIN